ncbi:hypothetical protein RP20_CCG028141 [Aedes albopictus]|nr:hypothetical protein RP20_CCG028141 [Aedes albopictus]
MLVLGWFIYALAVLPLPVWGFYVIAKQPKGTIWQKIVSASQPLPEWGPENLALKKKYDDYIDDIQHAGSRNFIQRIFTGRERSYSVNV